MQTNCPNCNSLQTFAVKKDVLGENKAEIYIACNMCRWKAVLFEGTEEQVKLKQDIDTLRGKTLRGDPIRPVLRKRQERLRDS